LNSQKLQHDEVYIPGLSDRILEIHVVIGGITEVELAQDIARSVVERSPSKQTAIANGVAYLLGIDRHLYGNSGEVTGRGKANVVKVQDTTEETGEARVRCTVHVETADWPMHEQPAQIFLRLKPAALTASIEAAARKLDLASSRPTVLRSPTVLEATKYSGNNLQTSRPQTAAQGISFTVGLDVTGTPPLGNGGLEIIRGEFNALRNEPLHDWNNERKKSFVGAALNKAADAHWTTAEAAFFEKAEETLGGTSWAGPRAFAQAVRDKIEAGAPEWSVAECAAFWAAVRAHDPWSDCYCEACVEKDIEVMTYVLDEPAREEWETVGYGTVQSICSFHEPLGAFP
jgi:hypothetical protein